MYNTPCERTNFKAVIVGHSLGWANFRHQADALAIYTQRRYNWVSDDNITTLP